MSWIRFVSIGSFDDLESALPHLHETKPDVVILDFGLPGISGTAAIAVIQREAPFARILVVTGIPSDDVVFDALEAGADGFADKDGLTEAEFSAEIRAAHEGGAPLSVRARQLVLDKLRSERPERTGWSKLTDREQEIARLLKRGLPNKEIARELGVSVNTVHSHLTHIFDKLDAHDRLEVQFRLYWGGTAPLPLN